VTSPGPQFDSSSFQERPTVRTIARRFLPRPQPNNGIVGAYFWALNRDQQIARIHLLMKRGLTAAQVASMTHETVRTVERLASEAV